jgi:hypothetical protein
LPIFTRFIDYKGLLGFASYTFDGGRGGGKLEPFPMARCHSREVEGQFPPFPFVSYISPGGPLHSG